MNDSNIESINSSGAGEKKRCREPHLFVTGISTSKETKVWSERSGDRVMVEVALDDVFMYHLSSLLGMTGALDVEDVGAGERGGRDCV